jgi:hypothetical protein
VADEVDRSVELLQFIDEPFGVVVFGGTESGGRAQPNPGSESATVSSSNSARTLSQSAAVSGTPWRKTIILEEYRWSKRGTQTSHREG